MNRLRTASGAVKEERIFRGVPVHVEWPKGSTRVGKNEDGSSFETLMQADYGSIPDTRAAGDEERLDVYIGPDESADYAYAVEQLTEDGDFDEYKIMLGFSSSEDAKAMFLAHNSSGFGDIHEIPFEQLLDHIKEERKVAANDKTVIDAFVKLYKHEVDFYEEVAKMTQEKLDEALQEAGIRAIVTSRAKRPKRLRGKLIKRDQKKHYQSFRDIYDDIVDLAGVRVALYLPADQDAVGIIIEKLFAPVRAAKHFPKDRGPGDSLGYVATHYLIQLRPEALHKEELRYADTNVEIQVASVLMHAWAEVTHDLIYKPEKGNLTEQELQMMKDLNGIVQEGEATLTKLQESVEGRTDKDLRFDIVASITKLDCALTKVACVGGRMIYIFDIDGTLTDHSHRIHHIQKDPPDWKSFEKECAQDPPIFNVIMVLRALAAAGNLIYLMTGRSTSARTVTIAWLEKYHVPYISPIYMRREGDEREDPEVKSEMLDAFLAEHPKEEIAGVFDDRPPVIAMFQARGLQVFQVTMNHFEPKGDVTLQLPRVSDPSGATPELSYAYVIEELKENGTFSEYKTLLGFNSLEEAEQSYLSQHPAGWVNTRVGEILEVPVNELLSK